jgi:NADH dehydrogenase FAD-containing subunit
MNDFEQTQPLTLAEAGDYQPRQLVLVGSGLAHLSLLQQLAARPLAGCQITLVSKQAHTLHAPMLPGLVAGRFSPSDCSIAVGPLAQRAGVRWLSQGVQSLDPLQQKLVLDDGSSLPYDCLSLDVAPVQSPALMDQQMPGAREHALFLYPLEGFAGLWPQVERLADARALRVAVIGASVLAVELCLALQHRLPGAALTLVDPAPPTDSAPDLLQRQLRGLLRSRGVTVLPDRVLSVQTGALQLGCGATLACDVPVITLDAHLPLWLRNSGLPVNARGQLQVNADLRIHGQSRLFAVPEALNGPQAVRAGVTLAHNLAASLAGQALRRQRHTAGAQKTIDCGNGEAWVYRAGLMLKGRAAGWLKRKAERRLLTGLQRQTSRH